MTKHCIITLALCLNWFLVCCDLNVAQDSKATSFWDSRQNLESQFQNELSSLIRDCRSKSLDTDAEFASRFLIVRDPQRQYIFFPPENEVDANRFGNLTEAISVRLSDILEKHAAALFELATQEAASGNSAWAYQLLHEILFFWPDHRQTRKYLGHRISGDQKKSWRVKPDRLRIKRATKTEKQFNWPAKSYWVASTNNFQITSSANKEQTRELAESLQRWEDVWRQVFFEFHNSGKNLNRWIEGSSKRPISRRKFKVFFFKNHNQFVESLHDSNPGISASTGYYNDVNRIAYFFADEDPSISDTWRHEMTHQLFQETRSAKPGVFIDGYLWLGEGIAMYLESLVDHGSYATLGGFDSRRLQFARLRRLKEQFRIPIDELSSMSLPEFQALPEIAKVYSQSAGITQYLMTADNGRNQKSLIDFLKLAYTGKLKRSSFEDAIGTSFRQIETGYDEFLKVENSQLAYLDPSTGNRELSLIGTKLMEDSFEAVASIANFDWLDLSACDVRGSKLLPLQSCESIAQLFLTGAVLDGQATKIIAKLEVLDLDLSGSNLTDQWLAVLANSKSLRSLNIAGTKVSAAGLRSFTASRPNIKVLVD